MARLGEILIDKGALSPDGLRAGLEACRRQGGRLGTWLVRLGFINESTLLAALGQQSGCPTATTMELATAPSDIRALLPQDLAKRHMAVAFARHGRTLDVALVNPNDLVLIDEISRLTGLSLRSHVATEAALTAALAIPLATPAAAPPSSAPGRVAQREWRHFWKLESTVPELLRALDAPAWVPATHTAATFPFLAPIVQSSARHGVGAARTEDLATALSAVTHRDQVASLVLTSLTGTAARIALFSHMQNKIMGWAAAGLGVVEEDFHTLILGLDRLSIFQSLTHGTDLHVGPLPPAEGNSLLFEALGQPAPAEAIVAVLKVRGKIAGFLWLDEGDAPVADVPLPKVKEAARLASLALEILVLRQKIKSNAA